MKTIPSLLAVCCSLPFLASALEAQAPRSPVRLDDPFVTKGPSPNGMVLAGEDMLRIAVWRDDRALPGAADLYLSLSTNGGVTWGPESQVTTGGASGFDARFTRAAVNGGVLHLLYADNRAGPGTQTLVHARSADLGASWTFTVLDSGTTGHEFAVDGNDVLVVYRKPATDPTKDELFTVWSVDGGMTFNAPVPFDPANVGLYDVDGFRPALQNGVGHIVLEDQSLLPGSGRGDLFYGQAAAPGAAWSRFRVDQDTTGKGDIHFNPASNQIQLVVDGNDIHVLWQEDKRGTFSSNEALYYRHSGDGGVTWDPEQQIGGFVPGAADVDFANVGADGSLVAIAWNDDRNGDNPTRIVVSNDGGATFGPEIEIPGGGALPADSREFRVFADGSTVVVGWEDLSTDATQIFPVMVFSTDQGATFSAPILMGSLGAGENLALTQDDWLFSNCSLNTLWYLDKPSPEQDAALVGGMRLPFIDLVFLPGARGRFAHLEMTSVDPSNPGQMARFAVSSSLGSMPNPDDPGQFLDLGPSTCLNKSLKAVRRLVVPVNAQGNARTLDMRLPKNLCGGASVLYFQGWVIAPGQPGGVACTSDVLVFPLN